MARPPGYRRPAVTRTRDALTKARGNLAAAAQLLGCSRQNVDQMITRHPELQKLCAELMQEELDLHEGTLRKLAIEKELPVAVLAFLNAKGRSRGWNYTRNDVVISGEVTHRHLIEAAERFRQLDDSDLARLLEARMAEPAMIDVTPRHQAHYLPSRAPADDPTEQG